MTRQRPLGHMLKIVLKIVLYGIVLAAFVSLLNFIVFGLLDFYVGAGIFWNLYWVLPLEGIFMSVYAISQLGEPYKTGYALFQATPYSKIMRFAEINFPSRPMVAAIMVVAGILLFIAGLLLASQAV